MYSPNGLTVSNEKSLLYLKEENRILREKMSKEDEELCAIQ